MEIKVKVYNACKYFNAAKKIHEVVYKDVKKFTVETLTHEEIDRMGFDEYDEFNEYLTITFQNGETATFRNSHVDVFTV